MVLRAGIFIFYFIIHAVFNKCTFISITVTCISISVIRSVYTHIIYNNTIYITCSCYSPTPKEQTQQITLCMSLLYNYNSSQTPPPRNLIGVWSLTYTMYFGGPRQITVLRKIYLHSKIIFVVSQIYTS